MATLRSRANGGGITLNLGGTKVAFATQADAPSCMDCGSIMVRNGSCYKCLNCGSTSAAAAEPTGISRTEKPLFLHRGLSFSTAA